MSNRNEDIVYTNDMLLKIKTNIKDKMKRGTLTFFFGEEPYLPQTKELIMTKWKKENDDVVEYDKFLNSNQCFWKELECLETNESKVDVENIECVVSGCIK